MKSETRTKSRSALFMAPSWLMKRIADVSVIALVVGGLHGHGVLVGPLTSEAPASQSDVAPESGNHEAKRNLNDLTEPLETYLQRGVVEELLPMSDPRSESGPM